MKFDTKIEKYAIICGKQNKQGAIEDMNKIFIICSKAFYKDIPPIKEKLEENGWEVLLPHTYEKPNAENEWYAKGKEEHPKMKGEMFI